MTNFFKTADSFPISRFEKTPKIRANERFFWHTLPKSTPSTQTRSGVSFTSNCLISYVFGGVVTFHRRSTLTLSGGHHQRFGLRTTSDCRGAMAPISKYLII